MDWQVMFERSAGVGARFADKQKLVSQGMIAATPQSRSGLLGSRQKILATALSEEAMSEHGGAVKDCNFRYRATDRRGLAHGYPSC